MIERHRVRCACVVLLLLVLGARAAVCGAAEPAARCLSPAVGQVLQDLVTMGSLRRALGEDFSIKNGAVGGDRIEFEIADRAQRSHAIALVLPQAKKGTPDGEGRHFLFYLADSPDARDPQAAAALLAAATVIDGAIPETAVVSCGGGTEARSLPGERPAGELRPQGHSAPVPVPMTAEGDSENVRPHCSLAVALLSAAAELAVLLIAIVFGVRTVSALPPPPAWSAGSDAGNPD